MIKHLALILTMMTCFLFLSLASKKNPGNSKEKESLSTTHSGYYSTGELKYTCRDRDLGMFGRGTSANMISKMKFKRQYFDKCGTLKIEVKGRLEFGCWRKDVVILRYIEKNKDLNCDKEEFKYPTLSEIETELRSE